jgi:uncharacterized DUF497 family protein
VGITYDPRKRQQTLAERGLDFRDAETIFSGVTLTLLMTDRIMASRASRHTDCLVVGW